MRIIVLLTVIAAAGTAVLTSAGQEQSAAPGDIKPAGTLRIGTFDSRAVAIAFASSKFNTIVRTLTAERDKAKAAGDEKRVAEIEAQGKAHQEKAHLQAFGRAPVDDLLAHIKDQLPAVAAAAGVGAIVSGVVYAGPDAELVDITDQIVKPFEPNERALRWIEEIRKRPPYSDEEIKAHKD